MNVRRFLIEGATLVVAAVLLGLVANAIAGSERKISLAASDLPTREVPAGSAAAPAPSIIEDEIDPSASTETMQTTDTAGAPADPSLTPVAPVQPSTPAAAAPATRKASKAQILERYPPTPDVPSQDIDTAQAKWLWDQGMLFLDARRTAVYNDGHIPRARSLAVWEGDIDDKVKALATEGLDTDMPVVIYCSGGECQDSHMLAQKLWGFFFNNIRIYTDGFPGWQQAGHPVRRGGGA